MSELTLALIKIGFLALLWVFAFSIASTIRGDLFGVRPRASTARPKQPRAARPAKGAPRSVVVTEGADAGKQAALVDRLTVGRGPGNTIALGDEYASTQHARFLLHEGRWYVEDLGSTNGTYVAGARISGATPVGHGSTLRLGRTVLELRK